MTILTQEQPAIIPQPRALTQLVQDTIVAAVRQGLYVERACALAGIGTSSYYGWIRRAQDPEEINPIYMSFLQAIKKAEAEYQEKNILLIQKAAEAPQHWPAASWLLERRFQREYALQKEGIEQSQIQIVVKIEDTRAQNIINSSPEIIDVVPAPAPGLPEHSENEGIKE